MRDQTNRPRIKGRSTGGIIYIRGDLPVKQIEGVLAHEIGHEFLHHPYAGVPRLNRLKLSRSHLSVWEQEADAVMKIIFYTIKYPIPIPLRYRLRQLSPIKRYRKSRIVAKMVLAGIKE